MEVTYKAYFQAFSMFVFIAAFPVAENFPCLVSSEYVNPQTPFSNVLERRKLLDI